jgi:protein-S-isoprenylcysteine O-methyltransferase Ste14
MLILGIILAAIGSIVILRAKSNADMVKGSMAFVPGCWIIVRHQSYTTVTIEVVIAAAAGTIAMIVLGWRARRHSAPNDTQDSS